MYEGEAELQTILDINMDTWGYLTKPLYAGLLPEPTISNAGRKKI